MLFTDQAWAESSPFRRALMQPYQPWRCVGWTNDSICFWVIPSRPSNLTGDLPDGLLVVGPEVLLEVVRQMESGTFVVYVMDGGSDEKPDARLLQLSGLWSRSRPNSGEHDYWYEANEGDIRPCSRAQHHFSSETEMQLELELGPRQPNQTQLAGA